MVVICRYRSLAPGGFEGSVAEGSTGAARRSELFFQVE